MSNEADALQPTAGNTTTAVCTNAAAHELPETLPADGKGYRKQMNVHLNYGAAGGAAFYEVYGPNDQRMPITYQYDTRKPTKKTAPAPTGWFIYDVEQVFKTWRDVVAYWPTYLRDKATSASS